MTALPIVIAPGDPGHIGHHTTMHALLNPVDSPFEVASIDSGTLAALPAAGQAGRQYLLTTTTPKRLLVDDGSDWVSAAGPWLTVTDPIFGAVSDGITDDTAAIQAAIDAGDEVFFPAGTYLTTSPLVIDEDCKRLIGAGRDNTIITNATGDVFTLTGNLDWLRFEGFRVNASAGHIFSQAAGQVTRSTWTDLYLKCTATSKSIYNQASGVFVDNIVFDVDLEGANSANVPTQTVPLWKLLSATGGINTNTFFRIRATYAGEYVFWIENTGVADYAYDNTFRDINFEICNGGHIKVLTGYNTIIENCNAYDLSLGGNTTRDLYYIGRSGTGVASLYTTIRNCHRHGGTLGGGLVDVILGANSSAAGRTTLQSLTGSLNLKLQEVVLINCDNATITNITAGAVTDIRRGKVLLADGVGEFAGSGSPENVVTANIGSTFKRTDGGANTSLYVKESGTGNTGWVAK